MRLNKITLKALMTCMVCLMMSMEAAAFSADAIATQNLDTSDATAMQVALQEITDDMRDVTNTWVGGKAQDLTCDDLLLLNDRVVSQKVRLFELDADLRTLLIKYENLAAQETALQRMEAENHPETAVVNPIKVVGQAQQTYAATQTGISRAKSSIKLNGFVSGALKRCQTQRLIQNQEDLQSATEK